MAWQLESGSSDYVDLAISPGVTDFQDADWVAGDFYEQLVFKLGVTCQ